MSKNNLPATKPQNENAERKATYSKYEIEKREAYGSDKEITMEPRYLLMSMDGFDQPMTIEDLEELHGFLGGFLSREKKE